MNNIESLLLVVALQIPILDSLEATRYGIPTFVADKSNMATSGKE